jgi:hypothetical protein
MDVDEPLMKEWIVRQPNKDSNTALSNIPSTMKSMTMLSTQNKGMNPTIRNSSLKKYNRGSEADLISELGLSN